jgi:DNA topoisomerase I
MSAKAGVILDDKSVSSLGGLEVSMSKSMVIVESPAKAKTIGKYLGKGYVVRASAGHIKDLPKRALGVDIKNGFNPTYRIIPGKEKIVRELKKAAGQVELIYLAADPDREGEAICQHLAEELNGNETRRIYRVLFNEITQKAIQDAFKHPARIDQHKVEAQQARRILDRLVGYKISPLLWQNVRKGLSAGRVQSVALRLIVDREEEIRRFVPEEYWNFSARLRGENPPPFVAKAVKHAGKKFRISNKEQADSLLEELKTADFIVDSITRKEKKRSPVPPFITSKLQQEAFGKLRFSVKKTMQVAQRLYEGIELGDEGAVGLITYMRTDSTRVSNSALEEARDFIDKIYGKPYLPAKAAVYRSKKGAQDAHEAIRPTSVFRTPEQLKGDLGRDELRLYELIWKRFVASQMNPALFDQTDVEITAGRTLFKAVGSVLKFDGFLAVYQEAPDEAAGENGQGELPLLREGEKLTLEEPIKAEQKFTQPPPRYSESTLVKALEERGIGRPSTYAQILTVIQHRDYVTKEEGRFLPTMMGEIVMKLLVEHFDEIFAYDYTAKLEESLDEIENGQEDWVRTLTGFYKEFKKELEHARIGMKNLKKEETPTGVNCDKCGREMVIRWGRFGKFMACGGYPECKNTMELTREHAPDEVAVQVPEVEKENCEKCGRPMVLKKGRYGEFLGCSGYPECRNIKRAVQQGGKIQAAAEKPLEESCPRCNSRLVLKHGRFGEFVACSNYPDCRFIKHASTGVRCPGCGKGEMVQRKSRRGKVFYSCSTFPECNFVLWQKPVQENCPECGAVYLMEKLTKKEGLIRYCNQQECRYKAVIEPVAAG